MKRYVLSGVLFMIMANACGQSTPSLLRPGGKIGFNISAFTKDVSVFDRPAEPYDSFRNSLRGSFTAGATLDMKMVKGFTFGIELLYATKGMSYTQKNDNVLIETEDGQTKNATNYYTFRLDYLELPLTINYDFKPETAKTMVTGYIGVAPALPVSTKTRLSYPKSDPDHENQKSELDHVNSFMKSFLAGVKIGESYPETDLYIDLRGGYTLSKVFNRRYDEEGKNLSTHMYTFTVAFGIRF